jgi:hypothetical protein
MGQASSRGIHCIVDYSTAQATEDAQHCCHHCWVLRAERMEQPPSRLTMGRTLVAYDGSHSGYSRTCTSIRDLYQCAIRYRTNTGVLCIFPFGISILCIDQLSQDKVCTCIQNRTETLLQRREVQPRWKKLCLIC